MTPLHMHQQTWPIRHIHSNSLGFSLLLWRVVPDGKADNLSARLSLDNREEFLPIAEGFLLLAKVRVLHVLGVGCSKGTVKGVPWREAEAAKGDACCGGEVRCLGESYSHCDCIVSLEYGNVL